jgi:hypothetical protein
LQTRNNPSLSSSAAKKLEANLFETDVVVVVVQVVVVVVIAEQFSLT